MSVCQPDEQPASRRAGITPGGMGTRLLMSNQVRYEFSGANQHNRSTYVGGRTIRSRGSGLDRKPSVDRQGDSFIRRGFNSLKHAKGTV